MLGQFLSTITSITFFGGKVLGYISIPIFYENFDVDSGMFKNSKIESKLKNPINALL
ncbi:MAG: hypothetical protein ACJA02_000561 [Myxococcota bacterium]